LPDTRTTGGATVATWCLALNGVPLVEHDEMFVTGRLSPEVDHPENMMKLVRSIEHALQISHQYYDRRVKSTMAALIEGARVKLWVQ
jgi:hypothetical protein